MGDLNALLRYICQYMPMAPHPGTMPASQPLTAAGSSSDEACHILALLARIPTLCLPIWLSNQASGSYLCTSGNDTLSCLQGECSEEHVCLPLFAFARKEDADKLEAIADEVLGTEEEGPPSRCAFHSRWASSLVHA